jgi:hypothetical protein
MTRHQSNNIVVAILYGATLGTASQDGCVMWPHNVMFQAIARTL